MESYLQLFQTRTQSAYLQVRLAGLRTANGLPHPPPKKETSFLPKHNLLWDNAQEKQGQKEGRSCSPRPWAAPVSPWDVTVVLHIYIYLNPLGFLSTLPGPPSCPQKVPPAMRAPLLHFRATSRCSPPLGWLREVSTSLPTLQSAFPKRLCCSPTTVAHLLASSRLARGHVGRLRLDGQRDERAVRPMTGGFKEAGQSRGRRQGASTQSGRWGGAKVNPVTDRRSLESEGRTRKQETSLKKKGLREKVSNKKRSRVRNGFQRGPFIVNRLGSLGVRWGWCKICKGSIKKNATKAEIYACTKIPV